ncbi:MAG: IS3 family transposase [Bacillota bacterium]|nr:IS3 family transposase [Bacillota bacterium]MDW7678231.1 IS3 family transposase [Bacillota bacterium]
MGYTQVKYRVIKNLSPQHPVCRLCQCLGVSRSGYYDWLQKAEKPTIMNDASLAAFIQECQRKTRNTYGYQRVKIWLSRNKGLELNHKRILRIMNKYDLTAKIRRRRSLCRFTSNTIKYKNRLKRDFKATAVNLKWTTDLTHLKSLDGIVYGSVIKDVADGYIVGCIASKEASTKTVIQTIEAARAYLDDKVLTRTILHSDQGTQYMSSEYRQYLADLTIEASMSRPGTPIDNAPIESIFSCMKTEWL